MCNLLNQILIFNGTQQCLKFLMSYTLVGESGTRRGTIHQYFLLKMQSCNFQTREPGLVTEIELFMPKSHRGQPERVSQSACRQCRLQNTFPNSPNSVISGYQGVTRPPCIGPPRASSCTIVNETTYPLSNFRKTRMPYHSKMKTKEHYRSWAPG